eukprot:TRINITY_DN565_c1_g1_i2.p1 TRINITY_DN565_c1_g1~~TRINITY_DN565_c1_g1_i2.p1  ORF type:complete len:232 (+),score=68.53 TRINITY_DN565_c1_g1_i2:41-697(+)
MSANMEMGGAQPSFELKAGVPAWEPAQQDIINDLKKDIEMYKSTSERKCDELDSTNSALQDYANTIAGLREKNTALQNELRDAKHHLQVLEDANRQLQDKEELLTERVNATTDELDETRRLLQEAQDTIQDLGREVATLKETEDRLKQELKETTVTKTQDQGQPPTRLAMEYQGHLVRRDQLLNKANPRPLVLIPDATMPSTHLSSTPTGLRKGHLKY